MSEADRIAAETPVRHLYRTVLVDRDLRWVYAAAVLGGGSRGLGVLNIFVPLYLDQVLGLDAGTIGLMYGVLLAASVPGPLVAGWLSDRVGRKPVIIGVYVGGAASIALFVLAGQNIVWLWAGIIALSLFSFVESPQLQALLADVTPGTCATPRSAPTSRSRSGSGRCGGSSTGSSSTSPARATRAAG